jgi:enamine deaminase RidA (YjgF/YER057c/UK114 family)
MEKQKRQYASSGAKWEDIVGYSRAIRVGNVIEISGTTAINEKNEVMGKGDAYAQTHFIIEKAEKALLELGSSLDDVVRTRMFTTDIIYWEDIGRAHGDFFRKIKPVSTLVEVSKLIDRDLLIEIEFTAIQ